MNRSRLTLRCAAATAAGLTVAATLPAALASASGPPTAPTVRLVVAQRDVTAQLFGKTLYLDPGVYVTAVGGVLQFDVQRASYAKPLTITQIISAPGRPQVRRPLPAWALDRWRGLRRFFRITVKNAAGKTVAEGLKPFCPDSYDPQRSGPNTPAKSRFPQSCNFSPFQLGNAWGIQRGWGVDGLAGEPYRLKLGKYTVTVSITRAWQRLLGVAPRAATATVHVTVVKGRRCPFPCPGPARRRPAARHPALSRLPAGVPVLTNPPASVLPDLIPLPSTGIRVYHTRATKAHPGIDVLSFGATVWIGGNARLDVEGFRSHGSPIMRAYQYFWRNGRVVGRARAGTMGFDKKKGHNHWHFEQFAQYRLLNANKTVGIRSRKVGFCIAPSNGINLLLPHALWQPAFTGFGGACGSPSALWVRETLPLGWGDTYFQYVAGQAFDITDLPNGTYYIEIIANPDKVLHETNYRNDLSLRKISLGGTAGHRTVRVPAVHGIDPEH